MYDWRLLENGLEIPAVTYADQPYIIRCNDGAWLCCVTPGQHVSTCRSTDGGKSWEKPVPVETPGDVENSYAVLLKAPSGRVFVFYNRNSDNVREILSHDRQEVITRVDSLGHFVFKYSDDNGRSWSRERYDIPFRLFECDRANVYGGKLCFFWNVGRPFIHNGTAYVTLNKVGEMGRGFFQRSEGCLLASPNLLTADNPADAAWETLPEGETGIRPPEGAGPVGEEHCVVPLSDGSFYDTFRTIAGHPAEAYSRDGGKSWSSDWNREQNQHCGEFMMRLKLSSVGEQGTAEWTAGNGIVGDSEQLFAYAADEGELFRLELRRHWDESRPLTLAFTTEPDAEFSAVDEKGAAVAFTRSGNTLSFNTGVPFAVECRNGRVRSVKASFAPAREWPAARPDMTPEVNAPAGARTGVAPSCRIDNSTAILENEAIRAEFQLAPALALKSLFCAEVNKNILKAADETRIFRIHAGGRTYDARDGKVTSVKPLSNGFQAVVLLEEPRLECTVSVIAERDELRFKLDVVNRGESGADFALAFPHLDGITLSAKPEDDFYLFPFGGGIIGGENCHFRSAYGQNDAWWQMVDLFSRTSGGGVYLRGDDPDASYKFLNLRKGKGVKHPDLYRLCTGTTPGFFESEHHWPHALSEGDYAGMAIDYAERPCAPGVKVTLPDAVIGTHAGGWKAAMQRYADWAAGVWPRQAFPGKLTGQWNYRAGMGLGSPLWKDGKYDTSYQGKHHKRPADIW